MTTVHTLASGSSGNAILVCHQDTRLLLDAGISCRRITAALQSLGLTPGELDAILITHTHSDHIAGLQTMLKRCSIPVYASKAAARDLSYRLPVCGMRLYSFEPGGTFSVGQCSITTFATSHDAPGSCGYRINTEDGSIGLLTDTGCIPKDAAETLLGVDTVLLEANHDVETLESGLYPYYLKQRILGRSGHLSNETAARFAVALAEAGASDIILSHLSHENNTPVMAHRTVERALSAAGLMPALSVAPRDHLSEPHIVSRRAVCRK